MEIEGVFVVGSSKFFTMPIACSFWPYESVWLICMIRLYDSDITARQFFAVFLAVSEIQFKSGTLLLGKAGMKRQL